MKILFAGIFDVPWSTSFPIKREFEKKGHTVVPFDYRTIIKNYAGDSQNCSYIIKEKLGRILRKAYIPCNYLNRFNNKVNGRYEMNFNLLSKVKKENYDLVFFAKAEGIDWENISEINKYANTWYWFMDPLKNAYKINAKNYAKQCTWCSATFSVVRDYFKKYNENSYFITEGIETSLCNGSNDTEKEIPVIFIGSKDPKREKYINYLKKNGIKIVWYGPGGDNESIYLDKAILQYKKSKLILNFSRDKHGFSDRVFQGMGSGSMVLSENCSDIEKIFKKGKHLDWFTTADDCLNKIKYYLESNELREKIASTGAKYVRSNFTWSKTVDNILKYINKT